MLLLLRKNDLTPLLKEVRATKNAHELFCTTF